MQLSTIAYSATPQRGKAGAPVTQQADTSGGDKVDFSDGINNGTEALMMPMADILTALVAGQQVKGDARIEITSGDQKFSYVLHQQQGGPIEVPCEMNGQKFSLTGKAESDGGSGTAHLEGDSPAGNISSTFGAEFGFSVGLTAEGKAGEVPYKQEGSIDLFGGTVEINGQANGEAYTMKVGADGNGEGSLGNKPVKLQFEQGPNGSFLIHEDWGTTHIEKKISAA